MVKINVHTERVREVRTKFKAESDHHDQIVGELQRALGRLDTGSWDGRSRAKAEPLLRRVRPEGTRVVEELSRLGQTLQRVAERFEMYVCRVELANGFGELTDAGEQRRRFVAEMDEKARVYGERYPIDDDFLAALAAMPAAAGCALGFDRLVMLATCAPRIDQVIWTPVA